MTKMSVPGLLPVWAAGETSNPTHQTTAQTTLLAEDWS